MSFVAEEIASQPDTWSRAADLALRSDTQARLPRTGERVAVVGCGTSLYIAQCMAALREDAGLGETDAFPASEFRFARRYDCVVALSRSGTTTEIVRLLEALTGRPTIAITTEPTVPAARAAARTIALDFADERSVVQTRFATATLTLWRAGLGLDLGSAIDQARTLLAVPLEPELLAPTQFTFLGTGWTVGLASEAALKLREAAQAWTESYPAMEFRHGPISIVDARSAVWVFGATPAGLAADIAATGARLVTTDVDPLAQLITAQRVAVALAERRGLNPDEPRGLTRSVMLANDA